MTKQANPSLSRALLFLFAALALIFPHRAENASAAALTGREPPPSCNYTLSAADNSFTSEGGTGKVAVMTTGNCRWKATSNAPSWIIVTSGRSAAGNGTVEYRVMPNSGISRRGTLTIADQTFTLQQTAAPCCETSS